MIRKIIKQGHNTLTVTLPSKWAKRFNLKPGEEVNIIERENGLFISSEKIDSPSEIKINIAGLSIPLTWKHIATAYRAGFDKIIVQFPPNSTYDSPYKYFAHYIPDENFKVRCKLTPQEFIDRLSDRFVGFEVIDYGDNFCVLKEIGQSTSKEFDSSLRRMFLLLLHMSEGIVNDLEKGKRSFLDKAHNVDTQVDKFHDFCSRVLNKTGFAEPSKSNLISKMIYILELVGDEFKHLAVQLLNKRGTKRAGAKEISGALESINDQLKIFYELYYKYDKEKIIRLFKLNKEFIEKERSRKGPYKEDVNVTIETINRYIYVLSEVLVAKRVLEKEDIN